MPTAKDLSRSPVRVTRAMDARAVVDDGTKRFPEVSHAIDMIGRTFLSLSADFHVLFHGNALGANSNSGPGVGATRWEIV